MELSRRFFLKMSGAFAVCLGADPLSAPADPSGKPARKGKTLVVVFLRGGVDGLNLVVPFADPAYAKLRRSIAIAPPGTEGGALDLDGRFGLHPRLNALVPHFGSGVAVAAHAVGHARNTRSHFEEQDVWETGVVGNTIASDGWVNRHLASCEGNGPIRAVAIGNTLPRIMQGKASAYAISGVDDLTLPSDQIDPATLAGGLQRAYGAGAGAGTARDLLGQTGKTTLEGIRELQGLVGKEYVPVAPYPETDLARKLREAARLIKAGVGLEVVEIDYDGWDTHQSQGGATGYFGDLVQDLGDSLSAFAVDLAERMDDVLVVTLSDFGRTAAENGTGGTDHGWANCMIALGGPVRRAGKGSPRKVLGAWPGLAPEKLWEGRDLAHTTDFRDVIGEAVRVHLGNSKLAAVLPGHEARDVGLVG